MTALVDARGELVGRIGQLRAEREQIALDVRRAPSSSVRIEPRRAGEAEPGVQLVDLAVRVDARIVLPTRVPSNSDVSPVSPVRV